MLRLEKSRPYDAANQLVTSTDADGKVTEYAYDAVGRMVKEGTKTYRYGYLDKVLAVTEGQSRIDYGYHVDGQLATATRAGGPRSSRPQSRKGRDKRVPPPAPETEEFYWDGLALVKRGTTSYVNEPHPGGGAAVLSSKDGVMFNDILGTTLGTQSEHGYASVAMTAFGDTADADALFTGKPQVDGLGHAFLFRNYRAGLGKWLTADPLGYPDGWNQLAYCNNWVMDCIDWLGGLIISDDYITEKDLTYGDNGIKIINDYSISDWIFVKYLPNGMRYGYEWYWQDYNEKYNEYRLKYANDYLQLIKEEVEFIGIIGGVICSFSPGNVIKVGGKVLSLASFSTWLYDKLGNGPNKEFVSSYIEAKWRTYRKYSIRE